MKNFSEQLCPGVDLDSSRCFEKSLPQMRKMLPNASTYDHGNDRQLKLISTDCETFIKSIKPGDNLVQ